MKSALTIPASFSAWPSLPERCKAVGCTGIELHRDIPLDIARPLIDAGLHIACINTDTHFTGNASADHTAAEVIKSTIEHARHLSCHLITLGDARPARHESLRDTIAALAEWIAPLATQAADAGITLALENGPTLAHARDLWTLIERIDHPSVGIAWNVPATLGAGEPLAVTAPTLNSRIRYVRLENTDPTEPLIRLRGIGYQGWIAKNGENG
jgi:sugar phosphate isomerase/epimerase